MEPAVLARAAAAYGVAREALIPLAGGNFSHVYEFTRAGRVYVLRLTPPNEEITAQTTRAYLAWMRFLVEHGASVPRPILSQRGVLLEEVHGEAGRYVVVALEKARGVLGQELPPEQWSDALYTRLGQAVGRMHALAQRYTPAEPALTRPAWDTLGNCFNPGEPPPTPALAAQREALLRQLAPLPRDRASYGLIHTDLHFGNLFVEPESGTLTLFDFDDCAYGWYVMDIAMGLFDALVLYSEPDKTAFATRFLRAYLRGYRAERPLTTFWLEQMPLFLKLLELGAYTQVQAFYDPQDTTSWVGRFMVGRRACLEQNIPYVALDWAALA